MLKIEKKNILKLFIKIIKVKKKMSKMYGFLIGSKLSENIKYKLSQRRISNIHSFDVILDIDDVILNIDDFDGNYINFIKLRGEDYFNVLFSIKVDSWYSEENFHWSWNFELRDEMMENFKFAEWFLKVFKPKNSFMIVRLAMCSGSIEMVEMVKSYGYFENLSEDEKKSTLTDELGKKKYDDDIMEFIFATIDFSNISFIFDYFNQITLNGLQLLKDKKIHFSLTDNYVVSAIAFKETECDLYTYLLEIGEITENRENLGKVFIENQRNLVKVLIENQRNHRK